MRQVMNESIEDERGLMKVEHFVKMFDTAFRHASDSDRNIVKEMLVPLIRVGEDIAQGEKLANYVSIGKLSQFIDFYNFAPVLISQIRHKNDTSGDLSMFMGKNVHSHYTTNKDLDRKLKEPKYELLKGMTPEEKQKTMLDMFKMKKVLNLISIKI